MRAIHAGIVAAALAVTSCATLAEDPARLPADTPASYRSECGSCHAAFPPGLLAADGWRDVMAGLSAHFGDNAAIPDAQRRELEDFLVRHAGEPRRFGSRREPARLTATTWFRRTHGTVRRTFGDPRVGSAANCGACHTEAEAGGFRPVSPLARELARQP